MYAGCAAFTLEGRVKYANLFMAALFVFGAAVQYNDPDPLRWIAVYLAGAVACLLANRVRGLYWLPASILVVCISWSLSLMPAVVGRIPFLQMFASWEMKDSGVEMSREMYGLLIIGGWMLVLSIAAIRDRRLRRADSASEGTT